MSVDLSFIIPSIRPQNWRRLYDSIVKSMKSRSFELIIAGPHNNGSLDNESNFIFIEDWGSPCRCAQLSIVQATGKYVSWSSDDSVYRPDAMELVVAEREELDYKDTLATRYTEGPNYTGEVNGDEWYQARFHDDLRVDGVLPHYMIGPSSLICTEYFRLLGGLDCGYEHINMAALDLGIRMQKDGGRVYLSSIPVMDCDQYPTVTGDHAPLHHCHFENDRPRFRDQYATFNPDRITIDYDNWKNTPDHWVRRFGEKTS